MDFRLGELFCGAGGLAWGAVSAGTEVPVVNAHGERFTVSHAWANDLDVSACQSYASNIVLGGGEQVQDHVNTSILPVAEWRHRITNGEDPTSMATVIQGSVVELYPDMKSLPHIEAFAFGFPCNDFSQVGKYKGLEGAFGPLYEYGVHIVKIKQPRFFVAENVEGLLHSDKGRTLARICTELQEAGNDGQYVVTPHLYRFEEYGVPQTRTRLVIVGISAADAREGVVFRVPAPTTPVKFRTAKDALNNPPISEGVANSIPSRLISQRVKKRLEHTLPRQNAWNADIPEPFKLKAPKADLSHIYRRLEADKPSYTITGNGGGGTYGYHWDESRALTNRERARLQAFPDEFHFLGGETSVRRQIGMAVPPLAAKEIFEAILKSYAQVPYPFVEASIGENSGRRLNRLMKQQPWLTRSLELS